MPNFRAIVDEYQIIQELRHEFGFSLTEILPYTTIKRSTFYYQAHRHENKDDQELLQVIKDIKQQCCFLQFKTFSLKLPS